MMIISKAKPFIPIVLPFRDSLGMNLYLDELEKKGAEVIPCSGLIRVSRDELV